MTKMPITANTYSTVLIGCLLSDVFCNEYSRRKGKESARILRRILCAERTVVTIGDVIIDSMNVSVVWRTEMSENEDGDANPYHSQKMNYEK